MSPAATEKSGTLTQRTMTELQSNGSRMGGSGSFLDCENTFRPDRITEMCERFSEFRRPASSSRLHCGMLKNAGLNAVDVLGNICVARCYNTDMQERLINDLSKARLRSSGLSARSSLLIRPTVVQMMVEDSFSLLVPLLLALPSRTVGPHELALKALLPDHRLSHCFVPKRLHWTRRAC